MMASDLVGRTTILLKLPDRGGVGLRFTPPEKLRQAHNFVFVEEAQQKRHCFAKIWFEF